MIVMICQHAEMSLISLHHLRSANYCHLMSYVSKTPSSPRRVRYRASAM
ncbi:unnamed protein product [Brassica oleracea var. botrytis]|uniref:Uncharacterized protein n=1 Tax=Brassica oleracea TaxID=3712 RepID=A0A3P6C8P1_BRAOL|nr:unnamed protein product [Brassica oleracea]